MSAMNVSAACALTLWGLWTAAWAADSLTLTSGESVTGTFEGVKNGRVHFQPADGKKLQEMLSKVRSLSLRPLANVSVKPRGGSRLTDLKLKGYEKSEFILEQAGHETRLAGSKVTTIDMELDFGRVMQPGAAPSADEEAVDIEELLEPGMATVVHFQPFGDAFEPAAKMASTRSGSYLATLEKKHRGRVAVKPVSISGWDSPTARKYHLTSLPQFWFYDRHGTLSEKLTERFTSADIDAALKKAR